METVVQFRSVLFSPLDKPDRVEKALHGPAHMVVADLEDGSLDKQGARRNLTSFSSLNVRVNAGIESRLDKEALAGVGRPNSIWISKCQTAIDVRFWHDWSDRLWLCVESVKGLDNLDSMIRASRHVVGIVFGAHDYCAEIGAEFCQESLLFPRSQLIQAARRHRILVADAPTYDLAGNITAVKHSAAMGFDAVACIHPKQVVLVNEVYAEKERVARRIMDSKEGVLVQDGRVIAPPHRRGAARFLDRICDGD